MSKQQKLSHWIWDGWCILSLIGIWPRFIEPNFLTVTRLSLPIPHLPKTLEGLKILHFSDLHWKSGFSKKMIAKLIKKSEAFQPDLICFTGDFLCRSVLEDKEGLKKLLNNLHSRIGSFAVLGNHDYERFVTINAEGDYGFENSSSADMIKGLQRLFNANPITGHVTKEAKQVNLHDELINLLSETSLQLLHNENRLVSFEDTFINVCGLGEYSLGRCDPEKTFQTYQKDYPGIILSHNPDSIPQLENYPGFLILSGHTHGGQVNLPE